MTKNWCMELPVSYLTQNSRSTGTSRLIRIKICNWNSQIYNSKSYGNHTPFSHVLICLHNSKFNKLKRILLGLSFSILVGGTCIWIQQLQQFGRVYDIHLSTFFSIHASFSSWLSLTVLCFVSDSPRPQYAYWLCSEIRLPEEGRRTPRLLLQDTHLRLFSWVCCFFKCTQPYPMLSHPHNSKAFYRPLYTTSNCAGLIQKYFCIA